MTTLLLAVLVLATTSAPAWAQTPRWSAAWIAHPEAPGDAFGVFHFRRTLQLPAKPERLVVHVSADNRYRLYVNGQQVSSGPARGDLMHWRYETVDLAPHLRPGPNVVAALVWNWGAARPAAQISHRSAFLLQADAARDSLANTGPAWKVLQSSALQPIPVRFEDVRGYYAASPGEAWDVSRYPWGWETPVFADAAWPGARSLGTAIPRGTHPYGEAGTWQLVPRPIPPMEERPVRFATVRRAEGISAGSGFLRGAGDLVVPARTRAVILLDHAHLTNAYPVLETSGGAGSSVTLTYAESLRDAQGRKGNRNQVEGKTILGLHDTFRPDGGARRRLQTLWFRTFRYVQAEIQTGDEQLRIHDLHGIFTAYPFEERARFSSDLPWLEDMWGINWRVARLCAWETYFDTPYYEQLQYVGDTRIQALISLYMSGDDRLVRNAIEQFGQSRTPDGITASRYPSAIPQYIPPFSLVWVAMVHDYWMHRDDAPFVRQQLPGVRSVLAWYESQVDRSGLLGPMPWWNFVDWAAQWQRGVPPGAETGHSAMTTLQFVYALQRAAELEGAFGEPERATRYRARADSLRAAVRAATWNATRGLFRDAPDSTLISQQTNVMAVLVDALPATEQRAVMERVLADSTLVQSSYYFDFYLLEALRKAGLADRYIEQLAPWREMLALGLTTTLEEPEPSRSDSHAWAAHPNYGLLATVLGVRPAEPGFRSVRIAPSLGPLRRAQGRIPHPRGDIDVQLVRAGARGVRADVTLPPGLAGVFEWGGQRLPLRSGRQRFELRQPTSRTTRFSFLPLRSSRISPSMASSSLMR